MRTPALCIATLCLPALAGAHAQPLDSQPLDAESASALVDALPAGEARLLHPGEGDARVLRVTPEAGSKHRYRLHALVQDINDGREGQDKGLVHEMRHAWSRAEDGTLQRRTEILAVGASDRLTDSMPDTAAFAERIAFIAGSAFTDTLDQRLAPVAERSFGDNASLVKPVFERFDIASGRLILPAEPVAEGAVWRTRGEVGSAGLRVSTIVTYTLDEIEGDEALIAFETFTVVPKSITTGEFAGTSVTTNISAAGEGSGHLVLRLDTGAIIEMWCSNEYTVEVLVDDGTNEVRRTRTSPTTLIIEPAPDEGTPAEPNDTQETGEG